jgi:hypothetical protein
MAKARSGGGITSTKNVRPPVKAGPPSANKINPGGAAQLGSAEYQNPTPLKAGTMPKVPLGNAVALNVGKGGPGAGRSVHRAGSQSATPQAIPIDGGSRPDWPWKG